MMAETTKLETISTNSSVPQSEASSLTWTSRFSGAVLPFCGGDDGSRFRLSSSDRVFGRSRELQILQDTFTEKKNSDAPNVVVVRGESGSGKTALVSSMRRTVTKNGDFFVEGKFDQFSNTIPFSALASCFSDIIEFAVRSPNAQAYTDSLLKEFGDNGAEDLNVIAQLITNLSFLIPSPSVITGEQNQGAARGAVGEAKLRTTELFRRFLSAMTLPNDNTRILLFMDDIQWGDPSEIQVLEALMSDMEMKHITFVIAYRKGEWDWKIDDSIPHIDIFLGDLDLDSTTEFLADIFRRDATEDLARILLNKTNGNLHFMNEFIGLLLEDKLIEWKESAGGGSDKAKYQWVWDTDNIRAKTNISTNVLELVTVKIGRLENDLQDLLKIASCIGFQIDRELLFKIYSITCHTSMKHDRADRVSGTTRERFGSLVDEAIDQGLLEIASPIKLKHTHDKVQECLYTMVENRNELHIRIGRLLCEQHRSDQIVFLHGVHQLNRGMRSGEASSSPVELLEMAKWNLEAGKMSMSISSFSDAATFLQKGMSYLQNCSSWESQQELFRDMYCALAEVSCSRGDHELCKRAAKQVMDHVNTFDSLHAVFALLRSLVMANEVEEASKLCTTTLKKLGYRFPRNPSFLTVGYLFLRVKASLTRYSDEALLLLPTMADEKVSAKIKLLQIVCEYAFIARNSNVFSTGILMLVQATLTHGSSEATPFIFAGYSILASFMGKGGESFRFGQLALRCQEKFPSDPFYARTLAYIGMFSSHWRQTFHEVCSQCSQAYRIGMQRGETIPAMQAAVGVVSSMFAGGAPLSTVRYQANKLVSKMREFNQLSHLPSPLNINRVAANLLGEAEGEMILTGELVDEEEALAEYEKTGNLLAVNVLLSGLGVLCMFLGKWHNAQKTIKAIESGQRAMKAHFVISQRAFMKGLSNLIVYKENAKKKYLRVAKSTLRQMEKWLEDGMINVQTYTLILAAELVSLKKDDVLTQQAFDKAIESARNAEYIHLEGLANERAAWNLMRFDNISEFQSYMEAAIDCYEKWEAFAKVERIRDLLSAHFPESF